MLSATTAPLQFGTDRLNIRYFTDATQDAVEVTAATADDLRAGTAPYTTAAAGSRRLALAAESLTSNTDHPSEDTRESAAAEPVHLMPGGGHTGVHDLPPWGRPGAVAMKCAGASRGSSTWGALKQMTPCAPALLEFAFGVNTPPQPSLTSFARGLELLAHRTMPRAPCSLDVGACKRPGWHVQAAAAAPASSRRTQTSSSSCGVSAGSGSAPGGGCSRPPPPPP